MTTISKDVLLLRVSMQVDKHRNPVVVLQNVTLQLEDLTTTVSTRSTPTTVQIVTSNVATRIA